MQKLEEGLTTLTTSIASSSSRHDAQDRVMQDSNVTPVAADARLEKLETAMLQTRHAVSQVVQTLHQAAQAPQ